MKYSLMILMFATTLAATLTGCVVSNRHGGGVGVSVIPILPVTLELDGDYYASGGYHYYYTDDRWFYSTSMGGPRMNLPRSHWPKNTYRKGHGNGRGNGRGRGR